MLGAEDDPRDDERGTSGDLDPVLDIAKFCITSLEC
jgi:hypothetical protein